MPKTLKSSQRLFYFDKRGKKIPNLVTLLPPIGNVKSNNTCTEILVVDWMTAISVPLALINLDELITEKDQKHKITTEPKKLQPENTHLLCKDDLLL